MAINGVVKWYNERLGYGFLERVDGDDIFVHYSEIADDEMLEEGEKVEFEVGEGPKGPMAVQVVKL